MRRPSVAVTRIRRPAPTRVARASSARWSAATAAPPCKRTTTTAGSAPCPVKDTASPANATPTPTAAAAALSGRAPSAPRFRAWWSSCCCSAPACGAAASGGGRRERPREIGQLRRRSSGGRVPAAHLLGELVGLGGAPGAGVVVVEWSGLVEDRIDDGPGGLDDVLAREQGGVARHRVAQQALVGVHAALLALLGLLGDGQLDGAAVHAFASGLGARLHRDRHLGAEAEAHRVPLLGLLLAEHDGRGVLELDDDLGGGLGQALSGAHVGTYESSATSGSCR